MNYKATLLVLACLPTFLLADDWPQWMGPKRDSVYRESGVVSSIPADGLKVLWRVPIAGGYAGPAVSAGKVFVSDYQVKSGTNSSNPAGRDALAGTERLLAIEADTGKTLWSYQYDRAYNISYGTGPRATPTVDGSHVYFLGAEGDLACLTVADGKVVWKRQLAEEYKSESPVWGHTAHPLVHGDMLYVLAGGSGSVVVALDKHTGKERWRALSASEIGYCPPTLLDHGGRLQLLIWHADELNSLDPETGKVFWSTPLKPRYGMSIAAPSVHGDLLYASGIGETGVMFQLLPGAQGVKKLWTGNIKTALYSANAGPIFDGQMLYGADCGSGSFIAAKASDGARSWQTYQPTAGGTRRVSHGTAFIVQHADRFFLLSETGDFIIAKLSPEKYEEIGRMHVLDPTSDCFGRKVVWSHPAFANRCLYARNDRELVCVSLAE